MPEEPRVYIHQEYPKWKYHWTGKSAIVHNSDEERALGGGWANTPAAFDPYTGVRPARTKQQNPVKWVDEWPAPGLSSEHRNKIKAALLRADAAFARSPDAVRADRDSMRHAFNGIANVFFDAGILTEQLLEKDIPLLVWDSAIAGGWWRFASETRQDIFPEELGHYWVWRDEREDWQGLFRAEAAEWRSRLLDAYVSAPPGSAASGQPTATARSKADPQERIEVPLRAIPGRSDTTSGRKGDITLLQRADGTLLDSVNFVQAEHYLGISSRRRQQLAQGGSLTVGGGGKNRRITVQSLLSFLPPP